MQKMLKLPLDSRSDRPLFELGNYKNIRCLLDTGANIAVWCADIQYFQEIFADAKLVDEKVILSGFGGNGQLVDMHRIPLFVLQNGGHSISFKNFHVALAKQAGMGCDMILPAVMFSKMDCLIVRRCKEPSLQILYDRDMYGFGMVVRQLTEEDKANLGNYLGDSVSDSVNFIEKMICFTQGMDLHSE